MLGVFDIAKFARLDELVMHSSVKEEQERLLLALQLELFALSAPQSSHVRYRMSPSVVRYNMTFAISAFTLSNIPQPFGARSRQLKPSPARAC